MAEDCTPAKRRDTLLAGLACRRLFDMSGIIPITYDCGLSSGLLMDCTSLDAIKLNLDPIDIKIIHVFDVSPSTVSVARLARDCCIAGVVALAIIGVSRSFVDYKRSR